MTRSFWFSEKTRRVRLIVWQHLGEVRGQLCFALLCVLGSAVLGLLGPWPLKIIFDHILLDKPLPDFLSPLGALLEHGKVLSLTVISASIVLIALLQAVASYFQLYITSQIGFEMVHALRRELFAHLQRLSLSFHNRARSGELLTKVTGDTNSLRDAFADWILTFSLHLLTLTGMFAVMFMLDWQLSLIALGTFPVLLYALYAQFRKLRASVKAQRKNEGKIASRLSEILTSVSLVQAFGRERFEEERFQAESAETVQHGVRAARLEAVAARTVEIVSAVGTCAVILFGSLQVLKNRMTPGDVLIFASYIRHVYKPIRQLTRLSTKFAKAQTSAERIAEILDADPDVEDAPDAIEVTNLNGEIVFRDVSFEYEDSKGVLKNVSFTLSPGERVALVGVSGAGKSTIASLILRLYDPQAGAIYIDGIDIRRYRRNFLRSEIGVVLQTSILFGTTVRENIAYGKPEASTEEIVAAAQAANAHEFILELDGGYDAIIGERGATLSGGQRQRIAIARALIRNAPILILDEPMVGLDTESEARVSEALSRLIAGKTCLLITHELRLAGAVGRVLVLQDGRIVERGRRVAAAGASVAPAVPR